MLPLRVLPMEWPMGLVRLLLMLSPMLLGIEIPMLYMLSAMPNMSTGAVTAPVTPTVAVRAADAADDAEEEEEDVGWSCMFEDVKERPSRS